MQALSSSLWGYSWFKAGVLALLALNTGIFLIFGTLSEALDSTAWLLLLVLFELETGFAGRFGSGREAAVIRGARLVAAAAICAAAFGYVHDREWLDALNTALWIAVVALLEIELRRPAAVAQCRTWFAAAAATLYSGLGALVLVWLWRGEWFDAYDAALWVTAFATIEINVLRIPRAAVTVRDAG